MSDTYQVLTFFFKSQGDLIIGLVCVLFVVSLGIYTLKKALNS